MMVTAIIMMVMGSMMIVIMSTMVLLMTMMVMLFEVHGLFVWHGLFSVGPAIQLENLHIALAKEILCRSPIRPMAGSSEPS